MGLIISTISIGSCTNKHPINKSNNEYFEIPLLKVIPNQLSSMFDSVVYFEDITKSSHKCHDSSTTCLIVVPDGNYGDTISQIITKKGKFTIWEDTYCSDSSFPAEEYKYLYFGVVKNKDYLFFIHKSFRNTAWFVLTAANIKLKRTNLKKQKMPPAADNVSSWEIKYNKNSFYFPTSSIAR